jgi:hypothetical protein
MKPGPANYVGIARPGHDLGESERFWVGGLGLEVLLRIGESAGGGHALAMAGWPGAAWHLGLVHDSDDVTPAAPAGQDLLVLDRGGGVDEDVIGGLVDAGGARGAARNPYWDQWGVTIADRTGTGWSCPPGPGPDPSAGLWCTAARYVPDPSRR